mmetsp:Transcript_119712/g.187773  ORF Transcript_119712/g.187773 Transcript_119712/m.187773 type:complete len:487 (+) Transcript_119712:60-1520(+)
MTENALTADLRSLNVRKLKSRAVEAGASEEQIDACEDEDDNKDALIRLIEKMTIQEHGHNDGHGHKEHGHNGHGHDGHSGDCCGGHDHDDHGKGDGHGHGEGHGHKDNSKTESQSRSAGQSQGYCAAPPTQVAFGKPLPKSIRQFLQNGIKMMTSDETRQLLTDRAIPKPGQKLIEMQRAEWDQLGFDQDIGCNALDTLEKDYPDDKELFQLKMEFIHTASRTFLRSLVDRAPDKLQSKGKIPRELFIQFFEACNTQCGVPEFDKRLRTHVQETKTAPNQIMIDMQKGMLEVVGIEKEFGCNQLSHIPKDFPQDKEIQHRFMHWQQVAQRTVMSVMQSVMPQQCMNQQARQQAMSENVRKQLSSTIAELSKGNSSLVKDAKKEIEAMSDSEKQEFVAGMQKKMHVFQTLPPDAKLRYMTGLKAEDKVELVKGLHILIAMVPETRSQPQQETKGSGNTPSMMTMQGSSESQEAPKDTPPAPPQQQMM